MHRLRLAVLIALATFAAAVSFSASAHASQSITFVPAPTPCLLDDPFSCGLTLPDGTLPHPTGGGRHPGGDAGDGGISGGNHDTYCAEQRAAMGDSANTAFGMQLLASIGC
jgi:hypothetical protein